MNLRDMFSKSKRKRSRTPTSDPSEPNHSFVNSVKSRVSGLVPARISQWFNSSMQNSSGNGSALTIDSTDSSEDEPDLVPPAKRKRYNSKESQYSQCFQAEPTAFHSESPELPNHRNVLYTSIQSAKGQNTFIRDANYASTQYIQNADESNLEASGLDTTDRDTTYKPSYLATSSGQSIANKRKFILESAAKPKDVENTTKSCAQASSSSSDVRPRFRSSLYGSPFYPGPTMYGGACASTYINHPIIKQKAVTVRESHKTACSDLSSSTRRILDLLENCPSPLIEAKRIPVLRNRNHSMEQNSPSPSTSKSNSYKMQELNMPSIASILRVKERSRLTETTKAARQIFASHSSTLPDIHLYTANNINSESSWSAQKEGTSKLKAHLYRPNRGEDPLTMPEPVQLPTAVLHIDKDNLPKFSITFPTSSKNVVTTSPSRSVFPSIHTPEASIEAGPQRAWSDSSVFKFASPGVSPVAMTQELENLIKNTPKRDERNVNESKAGEETLQHSTFSAKKVDVPVIKFTLESSNDWKCSDCWLNNKADVKKCVACGGKKPSAADKSTQKQCVPAPTSAPSAALNVDKQKEWKCNNCWIKNKSSMDKCAACGGTKPAETVPAPVAAPALPVKNTEEDWKCENCWIKNKSVVKKCAACGGSMSGGKEVPEPASPPESHSPFYKPADEKFQEILRAQKGKWECSSCLTRNEPDKTKCQCCEMEREGPSKEITPKPFTFPKESNINFKFGIDPKEQQKNIAKKMEQEAKAGLTILEQAETNNNNTYIVKFPPLARSDEKKPDDKKDYKKSDDKEDSVVPEGPKQSYASFTFGIPKTAPEKSPQDVPVSFEKPKEKQKAQENFTFSAGFLTPPKPEQAKLQSFPAFETTSSAAMQSADSQERTAATVATSQENANVPNKEMKDANTGFRFTDMTSDKSKPFSFGGESTAFSFGKSPQSAAAATTAAPSKLLFSSPQPTAATVPGIVTPAATTLFSIRSDGFSTTPTPSFSFGTTNNNDNKTTPFGSANNNDNIASPFGSANNKDNKASPFGSANNTDNKAPFGSTNNNDNRQSPFGAATNNDIKASPFGSGFKPGATPNAFSMGTAASLSGGTLGGGANNMVSTMGALNEPGSGSSSAGFRSSAQEIAWGGKGDTSFGAIPASFSFGSVGNQFAASGAASGAGAATLFGAQPAASPQNVFGMSGNTGGMFGSSAQPAQLPTVFGSQPAAGVFGVPVAGQSPAFGAPAPAQPPAFGAPTQSQPPAFNAPAPSQPSAFGAPAQSQPPAFGTPAQSQPSAFGTPAQSQPPAFGTPAQSQPPAFSTPAQCQPPAFGTPAQSQPPAFGTPSQSQSPAFGAPVSSQPAAFGVSAQPVAVSSPAFNFGANVFNFGQQAQQQALPTSVYSFGGGNTMSATTGEMSMSGGMPSQPMAGSGAALFSMGSAPAANNIRRVRKAVRRTQPR